MFYPVESLRRGGRFYYCWVADSWPLQFATITHRQLWSQDIRKICEDLLQVMNRESGYVSTRFSLRLSSQLMRGLVRLYQRKVQVFLGDLCMVNATVIKQTKKRLGHESPQRRKEIFPRPEQVLPQIEEIPENEERVEERIRTSGNVVANIEEITLKEQVIPEIQVPTDGFGEENPDQVLQQLLNERTLEEMLGQTNVSTAQNSYLLGLENTSTDKSLQDKSRLGPMDAIQMERISEHEMTFRKSVAVNDVIQIEDIEKDILQITEYPIPEISIPPPEKEQIAEDQIIGQPEVSETSKQKEPLPELQLEELEEAEPKRKRARKLIIDKKIKISANMLRQRLENVAVELRCQDSSDDIIDAVRVPADHYLQRPAAAGWRLRSRIGNRLTRMFKRNLGVTGILETDPEIEQMLAAREGFNRTKGTLPYIVESPVVREIAQRSLEPGVPDATITEEYTAANLAEYRHSVDVEQMDVADLPTQVLMTKSQEHLAQKRPYARLDDFGVRKLSRRCGYTSFKISQQLAEEAALLIEEQHHMKEKEHDRTTIAKYIEEPIPRALPEQTNADKDFQTIPEVDKERRVSQMLEEVGLATGSLTARGDDDSCETPLGSLDRTAVDLGDSEKTTDTQKFLRKEWSTQGTMLKIVKLVNQGIRPLTILSLLNQGPVLADHKAIVTSRCFTALLKLKQHNFVALEKDPVTLEITNIAFGSRFKVK